ncbi:cyclodehydratase [Mycobacterium sp. 21AC1]|uniref:cyclodehydratase n=1 Tax=[Mycobacterium] appelbergii TaxID=2939269 RepID=UPI002938D877|nr:cyclodehydratase [Mycobacterium sp. 21AC1]MDV3126776.1 cyclodehydratase [Mycobacterium sp. 21AC1]
MAMRYVLAPGRPVLLRPDETVQVGWDPRRAVVVHPPAGMTRNHVAELLRILQDGVTHAELHTAAAQLGVRGATVDELLAALTGTGLLSIPPSRRLRAASIRIHGRGPLSELLSGALRCSGARVKCTARPHARVIPQNTDLVVLADELIAEPHVVRDLHHAGVAHLAVRVRDGTGLVGPLVIPGVTSCLQCADLHRSDRDAAWPAIAAQLRGAVGSADRSTILATAALALNQVDLVIRAVRDADDPRHAPEPPPTLDTTLELDANGYGVIARRWSRHPACPCRTRM